MQELRKVGKNVGDRKELKVTYLEYNRDIKKGTLLDIKEDICGTDRDK